MAGKRRDYGIPGTPIFDGYPPVRQWLAQAKPDVAVVFCQEHGLNFFLDAMPTFAVGAAAEYRNADEGWGSPHAQRRPAVSRRCMRTTTSRSRTRRAGCLRWRTTESGLRRRRDGLRT